MNSQGRCAVDFLAQADVSLEQLLHLLPESATAAAVLACVWIFTNRAKEASERGTQHNKQQMDAFTANLKTVVEANTGNSNRLGDQIGRLESSVTQLAQNVGK